MRNSKGEPFKKGSRAVQEAGRRGALEGHRRGTGHKFTEEDRAKGRAARTKQGATRRFTPEEQAKGRATMKARGIHRGYSELDRAKAEDAVRVKAELRLMQFNGVEWAPGYEPGVPRDFSDVDTYVCTMGADGET